MDESVSRKSRRDGSERQERHAKDRHGPRQPDDRRNTRNRSRSRDKKYERREPIDHSRSRSRDRDRKGDRKEYRRAWSGSRERERDSRKERRRSRSRHRERRKDRRSRSRSPAPHDRNSDRRRQRTPPPRLHDRNRASRSPQPPSGPRSQGTHPPTSKPLASSNGHLNGTNMLKDDPDTDVKMKIDPDEDPETAAMRRLMGFGGFKSTKNTKVKGNQVYGVRKEKSTEYRQYMNRVGGFNRPLSPSR